MITNLIIRVSKQKQKRKTLKTPEVGKYGKYVMFYVILKRLRGGTVASSLPPILYP